MAENLIQLTVNTDTRKAVEATTLNALKANDIIRLIYGERPIIAATFVNKDGTAIAFAGGDTFEMDVDIDYTHDEYTGTLNSAYSGAVTSIAITFTEDMTGKLRDTGSITLKDTSNPSNRESVDYTAVVISGASNEIGTFTVSKTLTNSYASGDYGASQDKLMAQATEDDVNTGEWAAADKTAGLVSFRLDCRDVKFTEKLAAQGSGLEYQIKMEIKRYPSGSTIPIVLMQDTVYGRQTVRDLEDVTIPSDENWTAADSRYLKKAGISGGQQAYGGTSSGDDFTLNSTSDPTKGSIILGSTSGVVFDEVNNRLSIGTDTNAITIGGTSQGSKLHIDCEGATDAAELLVGRHSDTAGLGGHIVFARSRGTHAAETVVQSGDYLARISGIGYDGTDYEIGAQIDFIVDGTPGAGDMPGRIEFCTTADGSGTPTARMTVKNDGKIGAGTGTPDRLFHIEEDTALTNSVNYNQRFTHTTSGTPANGIGVGIEFEQETSAGNNEVLGTIECIATDVSAGAEDSALVVKLMNAGAAPAEVARFDSSGWVGIGYTSIVGGELLAVNGGLKINGTSVLGDITVEGGTGIISRTGEFNFTATTSVFFNGQQHIFRGAPPTYTEYMRHNGTALLLGVTSAYASETLGVNGDAYINGNGVVVGNLAVNTTSVTSGYELEVNGEIKSTKAHVCMYVSTAAATSTITSGVPRNLFENATIADTSAVGGMTPVQFTVDNTGKQIDYTGANTKNFKLSAAISMTASVSNQIATFYIAKNGSVVAASRIDRKIGTGADEGAIALEWCFSLANTNTVEIYCDLDTNGTITAQHAIVSIMEI